VSVADALASVLHDLLSTDPRRVVLGEDVRDGTIFGLTRRVAEDDTLAARLLATPLVPASLLAHAVGMACGGSRPIVVLPSATAIVEGLSGLREGARLRARSRDAVRVPLLIVAPTGPGFGLGGDSAVSVETILLGVPGLRVISAGPGDTLPSLLRGAAELVDDGPVVLLLPRTSLLDELAGDGEPVDAACARVLRRGRAATVFTWGSAVELTQAALTVADRDVGLVELVTVAPLDEQTLVEEARRTGKIVIVEPIANDAGVGAELAARLADAAILSLDAPITRVRGTADPFGGDEDALSPTVDAIAAAIRAVSDY
jgi:pyruvate/2-oxoglutarate/acetoin dehydrogenase E1 component